MYAYLLLSAAAVFVLAKWLIFQRNSRHNPTPQELDRKLLDMLNPGRDTDAR